MNDRKPVIYLIIIMPILLIGIFVLCKILTTSFSLYRNIPVSSIPNINGMLIVLPAFILWIPVSLFISNVILFVVPSLRKIAEQQVENGKSFNLIQSQKMLLKVSAFHAMVCVPLIIIGFII